MLKLNNKKTMFENLVCFVEALNPGEGIDLESFIGECFGIRKVKFLSSEAILFTACCSDIKSYSLERYTTEEVLNLIFKEINTYQGTDVLNFEDIIKEVMNGKFEH